MKKYIKTKNGVYEVVNTDLCLQYEIGSGDIVDKFKVYVCKNGDKIPFNQVLAEADTIEELCDEFVYINKIGCFDKSYVIYFDLPNRKFTEPTIKEKLDYIYKHYKEDLHKIKGAIYTDKGLIYVAKMNENGELELI